MKNYNQKAAGAFLPKLNRCIKANFNNEQFGAELLAMKMGMSRSNLYRKLKKITGKNISQYIRELRLKEAYKLLLHSDLNITEVSYEVGFNSVTYFSKSFSDYFKHAPSKMPFADMKEPGDTSKDTIKILSKFSWVSDIALATAFICQVL